MIKLDGLNMLNSVKAGTQTRATSPIAKDSAKESFKDVLGKSDDKAKSQTQEDSKSQAKAAAKAPPTQMKSAARPQASSGRRIKAESENVENLEGIQLPAQSETLGLNSEAPVESEMVESTEASADALPGAADPSSGMKATPDMSFSNSTMLGLNSPLANKSKDVASDSQIDNLTRRAVWSDFLRKMNEELGVDAEKVLAAFSTLTEKELASPPEQNVDKLVMALGLNPEQNVVAHKMFTDLISKTQSKSLGEELANSSSTINLSLMTQRELQRRQVQTSLDKMNSAFFMSRQGKAAVAPIQDQKSEVGPDSSLLAPELGEELSKSAPMINSAAMAPALSAPSVPGPTVNPGSASALNSAKPNPSSNLNSIVEKMEPMSEEEVAEFTQAMSKNNAQMYAHSPKMKMFAAPAAAAATPAATSVPTAASEGAQMTAKALAEALGLSSAGSKSESSEESLQEDGAEHAMLAGLNPMDKNIQAPKSDAQFQLSPMEPKQAPEQMSVPDLINNARIMVRDGGGEMRVSLTPEGMGEVNMKVSVENGRVNVEMITESDTAKKMIEKGLVDLKSSLHANNLSVDSIKVDTASNLGKQLEQQYQDAQRQQAQNFLQNFRQNDQGWRRENFVTNSAQIGKSQSQAGSSGTTPYPAQKRNANSRRLDLVA